MTRKNEAYEPGSAPTSGSHPAPPSEAAERPDTIRALRADDYPEALALWRSAGLRSLRPEGRDSPEAFEAQLRAGRQVLLGLERDGRLIGVVMVTHDGRKGWINRLAVLPDHRRGGVGRWLIRAAERHLEDEGLRVIGVLIEGDNDPSLALFEAAGYRIAHDVVYLSKRHDDRA
jgi:ribosomal protein S18 acetylase RimI-like enzyme